MPAERSLLFRFVRRVLPSVLVAMTMLFISAGTLRFWQAWAFAAVSLVFPAMLFICFHKSDPQLIERRLLKKEKVGGQKLIVRFGMLVSVSCYVLAGLDYRFGWSRTRLAPVPLWLTVLAFALILGGQFFIFWVMDVNRFAARIVQVEAGQTVADTGPYRFVRHPMYAASSAMSFFAPLALSSWIVLPAFVLFVPVLIFRLLNEEQTLRRDLPGYAEYCQRTRYRLVPLVW